VVCMYVCIYSLDEKTKEQKPQLTKQIMFYSPFILMKNYVFFYSVTHTHTREKIKKSFLYYLTF
jgi:hypothetical protein